MSKRNPWVRVLHMRDYAALVIATAEGHTREDLVDDYMLRFTLVHLVELVGEAAAHVDKSLQRMAPEIPWADIVVTRHRLIHGYDEIDYDTLWDVVTIELPVLLANLEKMIPAGQ